jgi:hypothetical protein
MPPLAGLAEEYTASVNAGSFDDNAALGGTSLRQIPGSHPEMVELAGGTGVSGRSGNGDGVHGQSEKGAGVHGQSTSGTGIIGEGGWNGVQGVTANSSASGVWGENTATSAGTCYGVGGKSANGPGVYGTGKPAGRFDGDVVVTGDVQLSGGDCAEEFDIANADRIEPGTVMVLGGDGILEPSQFAYDKRVAGVISGAGDYKPGIILDKQGAQSNRKPISLLGKAYCKVDAQYGAVETGDLLTTSPTPGHAMKACDQQKAFGAVIGKALRPLRAGSGLIPILIALQ